MSAPLKTCPRCGYELASGAKQEEAFRHMVQCWNAMMKEMQATQTNISQHSPHE